MNILMIGNGFDLDHKLRTSYLDFLKFVNVFNGMSTDHEFESFINHIKNNEAIYHKFKELCDKNLWINFFNNKLKVEKDLCKNPTWISFENEIKQVIVQVNEELLDLKNENHSSYFVTTYSNSFLHTLELFNLKRSEVYSLSDFINTLYESLNDLITLFEMYISYFIDDYCTIENFNPSILENKYDAILSFNYSHTFKRVYENNFKNIQYHFIHGEASKNCNGKLVLGIDDITYFDESSVKSFSSFTKYYQRIQMNSGRLYKQWLNEIEKEYKNNKTTSHLYIFGHSLDISDKDIIEDICNCPGLIIHIYYFDMNHRNELLKNLLIVLGKEKILNMFYNKEQQLYFIPQEKSHSIEGSTFEIMNDIFLLKECYKFSNYESEKLLNKIINKCNNIDLNYFITIDNVLKLHSQLAKMGIISEVEKKLADVCAKLFEQGDKKIVTYNAIDYTYCDYIENASSCPLETTRFIKRLNKYIKKKGISELNESKELIKTWEENLINCQPNENAIYMDFISSCMNELKNEFDERIWEFMIDTSINYFKQIYSKCLNEMKENSKDKVFILKVSNLICHIQLKDYYIQEQKAYDEEYFNEDDFM